MNGTADRPRICVRKSLRHIYATVVDDSARPEGAVTIFNVTTNTAENKKSGKTSYCNVDNAKKIGETVGKALKDKGLKKAIFDRAGYRYHGCVKAMADAIREAGIKI